MRAFLGLVSLGLLLIAGCAQSVEGPGGLGGAAGTAGGGGSAGSADEGGAGGVAGLGGNGGVGGSAGSAGAAGNGGIGGDGGRAGNGLGGAGGVVPSGSLDLIVTAPSTSAIVLDYVLGCGPDLELRGRLGLTDEGELKRAEATFSGLPVDDCDLSLAGLDESDEPVCTGLVSFAVEADQILELTLILICSPELE